MSMRIEHNVFYGDAACGDDFYFNSDIGVMHNGKVSNRSFALRVNDPLKSVFVGIATKKFYKAFFPEMVQNVEFLPKQSAPKVVKMTFYDGTVTTAAAQEDDEFNAEYGMTMCILKYIWGGSGYNTFFRKWIKVDKKRKADAEATKAKAEQDAERAKRKKEKNDARRARKEAEEREDLIDILASAIRKATGKEAE